VDAATVTAQGPWRAGGPHEPHVNRSGTMIQPNTLSGQLQQVADQISDSPVTAVHQPHTSPQALYRAAAAAE
jgi:hypothetical protein